MGTGPSSMLGNMYQPRAVILMSPYTTIKEVAKNVVSKWLGWIVSDHFNNLEQIS